MATNGPGHPDHWQPDQRRGSGYPGGAPQPGYGTPGNYGPPPHGNANQHMLYDAQKKSAGAAFLLWFFLGGLGVHRFYLGKTGSGAAMLILSIVGFVTSILGVGFLLLIAVGIWWCVDLLLVSGMVREYNLRLAHQLSY